MLEWLFAAAAITIVAAGFVWRCDLFLALTRANTNSWNHWLRTLYLRARNRPLRDFFAFIEAPPQRRGSSRLSIPLDRRGMGRTRATDIDPEGRRRGGPDPDDASGNLTEKDTLPAYEVKGGPPNYSQFLAVGLETSASTRSQITETVPVGVSPGTIHRTTPGLNVQVPHLPPPSYNPTIVSNHPVMCHSLTDS